MSDPELEAMAAVHSALEPLENPGRERVLRWAASKFDIGITSSTGGTGRGRVAEVDDIEEQGFRDVGDLVHAAQPAGGPEHALVVAYWFQELQSRDGWTGSDINTTLKNMGNGLSNVTKTLDSLKRRKPALVMQVGKSGRAQQARKTYRLTTAGVAAVRRMITDAAAGEAA